MSDCWLPVSAAQFAGDWPLMVSAGHLRCHQVEESPAVVPVFRPIDSITEYSLGPWSQGFPQTEAVAEGVVRVSDPRLTEVLIELSRHFDLRRTAARRYPRMVSRISSRVSSSTPRNGRAGTAAGPGGMPASPPN